LSGVTIFRVSVSRVPVPTVSIVLNHEASAS
jgi:hypothetical protein